MLPSNPIFPGIVEDNNTLLVQPRDPTNSSKFTGMNNNGASLAYMIAPIQNAARYNGGHWTNVRQDDHGCSPHLPLLPSRAAR